MKTNNIFWFNKEAEYFHLFHKGPENRTPEEEQRFSDLCDILLEEAFERNKDVFLRLKDDNSTY